VVCLLPLDLLGKPVRPVLELIGCASKLGLQPAGLRLEVPKRILIEIYPVQRIARLAQRFPQRLILAHQRVEAVGLRGAVLSALLQLGIHFIDSLLQIVALPIERLDPDMLDRGVRPGPRA